MPSFASPSQSTATRCLGRRRGSPADRPAARRSRPARSGARMPSDPTCDHTAAGFGFAGSSVARGWPLGSLSLRRSSCSGSPGSFHRDPADDRGCAPGDRPARTRDVAARARPSLGETALAVDAEGHLGDRVASALALAICVSRRWPVHRPGSPTRPTPYSTRPSRPSVSSAASEPTLPPRIRLAPPNLFRPRLSRNPGRRSRSRRRCCSFRSSLLPNPQDAAIAQDADGPGGGPTAGRSDRRDREGPRIQGHRSARILERSSPRSCASSPASSGRSPSDLKAEPGEGLELPRRVLDRSSIRPTSSVRRRSRPSAGRCRGRRRGSRTRTRTATRKSPPRTSRSLATSSTS